MNSPGCFAHSFTARSTFSALIASSIRLAGRSSFSPPRMTEMALFTLSYFAEPQVLSEICTQSNRAFHSLSCPCIKLESFSPSPLSIFASWSMTKRRSFLPRLTKAFLSSPRSAIAAYGSFFAVVVSFCFCTVLNTAYLSRSAGCFMNLAVYMEFPVSSSIIIAQVTAFSRFLMFTLSIKALIFSGFSFTYNMIKSRCDLEYAMADFTAISKVWSRSSLLPVMRTRLIGSPINGNVFFSSIYLSGVSSRPDRQ